MAATTLQQIADGIVTRLQTIPDLRTNNVRPHSVVVPCAFVELPSVSYHRQGTMGHGKFSVQPTIIVVVSKTIDRIGQEKLMSYMDIAGTYSIHAAIEADKTLGGVVDYCIVQDAVPDETISIGTGATTIEYYGCLFPLEILAPGV